MFRGERLQGRAYTIDSAVPVTERRLAKQPCARIPRTVVALEEPAPAGVEPIEDPDWPSHRAREVRRRRVDRNDQIEIRDQRGRIDKIIKLVCVVDDGACTGMPRAAVDVTAITWRNAPVWSVNSGLIHSRRVDAHARILFVLRRMQLLRGRPFLHTIELHVRHIENRTELLQGDRTPQVVLAKFRDVRPIAAGPNESD